MTANREAQLEAALTQFLKPIKGIPFDLVIKSLCEKTVISFDTQNDKCAAFLQTLSRAIEAVCAEVTAKPIERRRPNEVGNDLEPFVISALKHLGVNAAAPKAKSGKGKSTGYPDIVIKEPSLPTVYLEVKSYAAETHATTQRSFYLSPSDDPKVTDDGHHILAGFEIKREGNKYWPVAFEIVDLYGLDCDMKAEFNSDNKRLYTDDRVLLRKRMA